MLSIDSFRSLSLALPDLKAAMTSDALEVVCLAFEVRTDRSLFKPNLLELILASACFITATNSLVSSLI